MSASLNLPPRSYACHLRFVVLKANLTNARSALVASLDAFTRLSEAELFTCLLLALTLFVSVHIGSFGRAVSVNFIISIV